ncbi:sialate O-acetylesterase [uncultured Christiangramia sp.]|uniref:sialate O-acetylesterase n=1 Tax=uncultured Christiangramia sp. TaxID=503836 RepID=UPI0025D480B5|nr:sialate O-acetylesterase [uncultured Christiangramia sp.]|tara:strand:+ start:2979 stop:4361 length:1383 start_codon:yes stop_codon:yes gene_type:complete
MKPKFSNLLFAVILIPGFIYSNVSLPAIFGDNMVLQRNAEVKIWGWAKPGEEIQISVSWSQENFKVKPDSNGNWQALIPTNEERGSQTISIKGYTEVILKNVLMGEVWLISGQSNMEWTAGAGIEGGEEAIKNSENSNIRFFTVNHRTAQYPQNDLRGEWSESSPETMKNFSAVAYFFAQKLSKELDVPVGLVNATWGGTPAEPWMPISTIKNDSTLTKAADLLPETEWGPSKPGLIYNAMVNPFKQFKFSGILWYQGESNTANADYYEEVFSALIKSWRAQFQDELPFYFAQIAPFNYETEFSGVKIRDAQRKALKLPHTGMVMTGDIGNIDDIHPKNKKEVGIRFANLVLADKFKKEVKAYAPIIEKAVIQKNNIILSFNHSEGLQVNTHNKASQFEIAGEDKEFHPVDFRIKDEQIVLKKGKLKDPVFVRYSWTNTGIPNISNDAGLPSSSFTIEIE